MVLLRHAGGPGFWDGIGRHPLRLREALQAWDSVRGTSLAALRGESKRHGAVAHCCLPVAE